MLKDFPRKCSKTDRRCKCGHPPHKLRHLESMAELSEEDFSLIYESVPQEEWDIIERRIASPWPTIILYGDGLEDNFYERYPLNEVILPIGATRIIKHPSFNAISILFQRGSRLQYIEVMMSRKWP